MSDRSSNASSEYEDPKNLPPILDSNPKNEFNFLENFIRRLICQLGDLQERKRAANWLKILKKNETEPLAVHYLLILMLALTRKRLVKPFDVQPPDSITTLGKLKLRGMCRFLIEQYRNVPSDLQKRAVKVSYSDDFKQYGCVQNLDGKGVQCYCAFSSVPVTNWDNVNNLRDYNLQQSANYLSYKMSLIEDTIQASSRKSSDCPDNIPEHFLHYIMGLKRFKMPFVGRLHVRGINSYVPRRNPSPGT